MTDQEGALLAIASRLESLGIPYTVIGGLANAVWGEPRATLDIDIVIRVSEEELPALVERLADPFAVLPDDPVGFVRDTRVLPLETPGGVRIDVVFGMLPIEESAIGRSVTRTVAGSPIRFCTAEDLVLFKIISDREQDLRDVRGILRRSGASLDRAYLDARVQELSEGLERPEIWDRYESWLGNS